MPLPLTQSAFVAGTLIVLLAGSLSAKAPTVRLTIAGADLPAPIETSDPAALANIWAGTFIGNPCQAPDTSLPRYRVTFHVRWADGSTETVEPKYTVLYVRDARTNAGFVYLPGRGEDGYTMNAKSMLRDGQDGHWHRAQPEWSEAIARALVRRRADQGAFGSKLSATPLMQ